VPNKQYKTYKGLYFNYVIENPRGGGGGYPQRVTIDELVGGTKG